MLSPSSLRQKSSTNEERSYHSTSSTNEERSYLRQMRKAITLKYATNEGRSYVVRDK